MDFKKLKENYEKLHGIELDLDLIYAIVLLDEINRADKFKLNTHKSYAKSEFRGENRKKFLDSMKGVSNGSQPNVSVDKADKKPVRKKSKATNK
jgi:hypothetical protein